jgi:hypothetical protein
LPYALEPPNKPEPVYLTVEQAAKNSLPHGEKRDARNASWQGIPSQTKGLAADSGKLGNRVVFYTVSEVGHRKTREN